MSDTDFAAPSRALQEAARAVLDVALSAAQRDQVDHLVSIQGRGLWLTLTRKQAVPHIRATRSRMLPADIEPADPRIEAAIRGMLTEMGVLSDA
jgi:hypothetical protein